MLGERACEPALPQHGDGVDVDQVRGRNIVGISKLAPRPSAIDAIVADRVGQDRCVDHD